MTPVRLTPEDLGGRCPTCESEEGEFGLELDHGDECLVSIHRVAHGREAWKTLQDLGGPFG